MAKIKLAKKTKTEAFDKDAIDHNTIDDFYYVDHFLIQPDNSDKIVIVKLAKDPGAAHQFKVIAISENEKPVTLLNSTFESAALKYMELMDMDPAEALAMISHT